MLTLYDNKGTSLRTEPESVGITSVAFKFRECQTTDRRVLAFG